MLFLLERVYCVRRVLRNGGFTEKMFYYAYESTVFFSVCTPSLTSHLMFQKQKQVALVIKHLWTVQWHIIRLIPF